MDRKQELVAGLRGLADWLDAHPELPTPYGDVDVCVFAKTRDELAQIARLMGKADKREVGGYMELAREFGPCVKFSANIERDRVCERVVVGTREVEKPDPDAPKVTVTEEIVEWRCQPILGGVA